MPELSKVTALQWAKQRCGEANGEVLKLLTVTARLRGWSNTEIRQWHQHVGVASTEATAAARLKAWGDVLRFSQEPQPPETRPWW